MLCYTMVLSARCIHLWASQTVSVTNNILTERVAAVQYLQLQSQHKLEHLEMLFLSKAAVTAT